MVLVFGKTLEGVYLTLLLKKAAIVFIKHVIFPRQFYTDAGLQEKLLTLLRYIITQPFNILGDLNVDQSFNRSTKGRRLVRMEHQRYELFLTPPPPLAGVLLRFQSRIGLDESLQDRILSKVRKHLSQQNLNI